MDKTLIIGHVWPEPTTTAAGKRMSQLIAAFLEFGHEVIFGCTALRTEYSLDLQTIGVKQVELQLNHSSFDDFILDLQPDFVVFDRFMTEEQFGWRVAEHAPNAVRVLNTEDLHSLRKSREACFRQEKDWDMSHWKNHPMTLREIASIYRSDLTLMISSFEMQLLNEHVNIPDKLVLHFPFMQDEIGRDQLDSWPNFHNRQDFSCIGNGKHAPNVEAIKTLKKKIWPLIRRSLPEAKLSIYGAYLPQQVQEMHNVKEGFLIKGWVENLNDVLQNSRVLLVPIQFGAGIKGKLVDAMRNGTPSVTTPIGAEGMHGDLPWAGSVSQDMKHFAQHAIALYTHQEKWQDAQINGLETLNLLYSKSKLQKLLEHRLDSTQQHLNILREQNLMGRILQQQGLAATKYMGKWIEAKNGYLEK
nr:glycosyltransferase [Allomuricauda sp.]